jgi:hypothetical protein
VAAVSADGVVLALNAQRSNRSAADPAAVRGATRSPMSAQREQLCDADTPYRFHSRWRIGIHDMLSEKAALFFDWIARTLACKIAPAI